MEPLQTLIVDDEPLARERLRTLLANEEDVRVVGECAHGAEAVAAVRRLDPDLVLLDVQMPEMDGFEVVRQIDPAALPLIIFCTAYDEYAVRAFEANAVDYLLKPVDASRLREAVARARSRSGAGRAQREHAALSELLAAVGREGSPRRRIAVREGERFVVVRTDEILWVEAADNYVILHTRDGARHRHRARMSEVEEMLEPGSFLRIHRSVILNVDQVRVIEPWGMGEFLFVLSNDHKLTSSRRYRGAVRDAFGC